MDKELEELFETYEVQRLLKAARGFISLLEKDNLSQGELIFRSRESLSELYAAALNFPEVPLRFNKDKDFEMGELDEELRKGNKNLINKVKDGGLYWEVFDPVFDKEEAPTLGWLGDDFSDMYNSLKSDLYKIDVIASNESIENGLWSIEFGFRVNWGHHCINALRALHFLAG